MAKLIVSEQWVLVTGASSGLGREMARYLAKYEGANLVITARRKQRLLELKQEIESCSTANVICIVADLNFPSQVKALVEEATRDVKIRALINNAGATAYGISDSRHFSLYETILDVNLKSAIQLNLLFVDYFSKEGRGSILNISSQAGLIPLPYQSVYSASKHGLQAFSDALSREKRTDDLLISTFIPGGINTELLDYSGLQKRFKRESWVNMDAERAARIAIKGFLRGKARISPGVLNKLMLFLIRFVPRTLLLWLTEKVYRPKEIVE